MSESFGEEVMGDIAGVGETALHGVEGVRDAANGDWDGAADSSLSMSESAVGVATGGLSELAEAGWDAATAGTGLPTAHEALHDATQAAGNAIGDGMFDLVGADQSHQAAVAFDDGDYLGGLGHMAEGAADTIGHAIGGAVDSAEHFVGDAVDSVEQGAEDMWNQITE
jgi:hypothetical protein